MSFTLKSCFANNRKRENLDFYNILINGLNEMADIDCVKAILVYGRNVLIKNVKQNQISVQSSQCSAVIPRIFQITSDMQIEIDSLSLNKPTLDDVFISYTGRNLRDDTTKKFNKRKEFNLNRRRGL